MRSMYKYELARMMGVSHSTMARYLRKMEHLLPHYDRNQTLLTPDQVRIVCEHFCIEMSP